MCRAHLLSANIAVKWWEWQIFVGDSGTCTAIRGKHKILLTIYTNYNVSTLLMPFGTAMVAYRLNNVNNAATPKWKVH